MCMVKLFRLARFRNNVSEYSSLHGRIRRWNVIAEIAPAFVGQFGDNITREILKPLFVNSDFRKCMKLRLEQTSARLQRRITMWISCDGWTAVSFDILLSFMVCHGKKNFSRIWSTRSPRNLLLWWRRQGQLSRNTLKQKVVFIGPCAAKKLEASRRSVRSDVDFVVTFEELQAMFDAKEIDLTEYEAESSFHDATGAGRGYGCAGGVAEAIEKCINEYYPDVQVNIEHAEGLKECKKILTLGKGRQDERLVWSKEWDVREDVLPERERIFLFRRRRKILRLSWKTQVSQFRRKN